MALGAAVLAERNGDISLHSHSEDLSRNELLLRDSVHPNCSGSLALDRYDSSNAAVDRQPSPVAKCGSAKCFALSESTAEKCLGTGTFLLQCHNLGDWMYT